MGSALVRRSRPLQQPGDGSVTGRADLKGPFGSASFGFRGYPRVVSRIERRAGRLSAQAVCLYGKDQKTTVRHRETYLKDRALSRRMVRLPSEEVAPTAPGDERSSDPIDKAIERGRKRALSILLDEPDEPGVAVDGGLHPATIRWLAAHPDADTEAVLAYDRNTRPYRDTTPAGTLPPSGDPGSSVNHLRSVEVNAARAAIRQYYGLEERTQ